LNFGVLVSTITNVLLPAWAADKAILFLSFKLIGEEDADFVYNVYNPQIALALKDIKTRIPHDEIVTMGRRVVGTLMKIVFVFCFQEEMPPIPFLWKPLSNNIAALILPTWNKIADHISGTPQLDEWVTQSIDVYPGDDTCRGYSPHALWHEESANGLLEITLLCDYFNGVVQKYSQ